MTSKKYLWIFNIEIQTKRACLNLCNRGFQFTFCFSSWDVIRNKTKKHFVSWWWCSIWRFNSSTLLCDDFSSLICNYARITGLILLPVCVIFVNFVIWLRSEKSRERERDETEKCVKYNCIVNEEWRKIVCVLMEKE